MSTLHHFALLAPVPREHLLSGCLIAEATGFVAFGTRKWELLRELNTKRCDDDGLITGRVAVLIYASLDSIPAQNSSIVSWFGWYDGSEETSNGAHSQKMKHRPPTTAAYPTDNRGHWAAFWHVRGLRELPLAKRKPVGEIARIVGGLRKNAAPHGPELVELPETLSYEV